MQWNSINFNQNWQHPNFVLTVFGPLRNYTSVFESKIVTLVRAFVKIISIPDEE